MASNGKGNVHQKLEICIQKQNTINNKKTHNNKHGQAQTNATKPQHDIKISETKKNGLQKFYNIKDEDTLKFFTVHMHADKWHRKVVRNIIKKVADSKSKQNEITASVESALGALNNFLTGMERVYC